MNDDATDCIGINCPTCHEIEEMERRLAAEQADDDDTDYEAQWADKFGAGRWVP